MSGRFLTRLFALVLVAVLAAACAGTATPSATSSAPQATAPGSAAPGSAAPGSAAPGSAAAGSAAPASAAAGSTAPGSAAPGTNETLILGQNTVITSNDPAVCAEWDCTMIQRVTYQTLVTWAGDDYTKVVPLLATSWDISADGKTYTFKLQPKISFASGRTVTAADIKFSYDRLRNKKGGVAYFMDSVDTVEAVDDLTLRINLKAPNAAFLSILTSPAFGAIDSVALKSRGGTSEVGADKTDQATPFLDQNSLGSGPYTLTKWAANDQLVIERNPTYSGTPATFAKIIIKYVADAQTELQLLQRGDIDIAMDLNPDTINQLKAGGQNIKTIQGNALQTLYLGLSPDPARNPALADQKVRQAIAYAIDYDGIVNDVLKGASRKIPSIFPIGFIGVDPNLVPERHNVDKAKALLAASGFSGKVSFKLTFLNQTPNETVVQKIQSDLAAVGIQVTLDPKVGAEFYTAYRAGKVEAVYSLWGPDYIDPDDWAQAFAVTGGVAAKRLNYKPAFTDLAGQALLTTDTNKRAEIYRQIQLKLLDDAVFIGVQQQDWQIALRDNIQGYVVNAAWRVNLADLSRSH